jgi:hypothetical protein
MVSTLIYFNSSNENLWSINTEKTIKKSRRISFVRARMMFVAVVAFIGEPQPIERSFGTLSESVESICVAMGV